MQRLTQSCMEKMFNDSIATSFLIYYQRNPHAPSQVGSHRYPNSTSLCVIVQCRFLLGLHLGHTLTQQTTARAHSEYAASVALEKVYIKQIYTPEQNLRAAARYDWLAMPASLPLHKLPAKAPTLTSQHLCMQEYRNTGPLAGLH